MAYKEKILIIRFSSLGDVVLVHPVIRKLYNAGFEVHFLTQKEYIHLFTQNPYVNKIIPFNKRKDSLWKIIKIIKKENYYRIIDLQKNLRSIFILFYFFNKSFVYKKYKFRRWLLVHFKINLLKNNSVIKNYLNVLKKLNIKISSRDYNYTISTSLNIANKIKSLLKNKRKKIISIAPVAKWETKIWWGYAKLIEILSKKFFIVLLGTKEEQKRINLLIKNPKNVLNLAGKLNLLEIVEVIKNSSILITNDSGIMHLGAGTDTPLIAIFGSTVKEFGFVPLRKNVIIIESNNVKCRPCDYHGRNKCPKSHFKCMKNISVETVLNKIKKVLRWKKF